MPLVEVPLAGAPKMGVAKAATEAKLVASVTEARKMISQGGLRVNGDKVQDPKAELDAGEYVIQVGKLKAARVKIS
jgi:tyrosyl-tRNA synthetase